MSQKILFTCEFLQWGNENRPFRTDPAMRSLTSFLFQRTCDCPRFLQNAAGYSKRFKNLETLFDADFLTNLQADSLAFPLTLSFTFVEGVLAFCHYIRHFSYL